jgi:molybdopterin biosynthesis enzyme
MFHPQFVADVVDIKNNTTVQITTGAAAAKGSALVEGVYDVWSTQDTWVAVIDATATPAVTLLTGYLVRANNTVSFAVRNGDTFDTLAGGAGTLNVAKVG